MKNKTNFCLLFGTREYLHDEPEDGDLDIRTEETLVGLFSTRALADEYVTAAKLPTADDYVDWRNQDNIQRFHPNSLLNGFANYCIKPLEVPHVELDPKPKFSPKVRKRDKQNLI